MNVSNDAKITMNQAEQKILDNLIANISILGSINDGVYIVDTERRVLYWNTAAEQITGYKSSEVVGKHCMDNILNHIDDQGCSLCQKKCPLAFVMQDGKKRDMDVYLHHRNGFRLPVKVRATPIHSTTGKIIACVEIFQLQLDAISTMDRLNQIENSSHIDSVTGLPDWHYFRQELINNITTQTTSQPRSCMISFQLEHFKTLEQQHGQQLIDQAMQIISKCLTANCKIHDTIARIDSDHLALLTLATDADHARQIAGKFQNLLCQCTCAIPNGRINLSVTSQATMIKIDESVHGLLSRLNLDIESIQSKAA
ncbi:MAG TPA: hypothetical protein DCM28_18590 [Phycisphaerales bacterium]|nr:hypothetical protein [Phycisphaerales bacterium]HCD33711.1 hypothetical protein [Phycisphaerales bacterium]|tara:strand:- start:886 stop:1821 length:936 start_codon:yes stop_codon:yes gene_type:complete